MPQGLDFDRPLDFPLVMTLPPLPALSALPCSAPPCPFSSSRSRRGTWQGPTSAAASASTTAHHLARLRRWKSKARHRKALHGIARGLARHCYALQGTAVPCLAPLRFTASCERNSVRLPRERHNPPCKHARVAPAVCAAPNRCFFKKTCQLLGDAVSDSHAPTRTSRAQRMHRLLAGTTTLLDV